MKKALCMLLSFVMLFSVVPMDAFAEEGGTEAAAASETTTDDLGVALNKTSVLEDDGTYTITLEAYAKGETQTVYQPMDILFVLDQSGSMLLVDDATQTVYVDGDGDGDVVAEGEILGNISSGGVDLDGNGTKEIEDHNVSIAVADNKTADSGDAETEDQDKNGKFYSVSTDTAANKQVYTKIDDTTEIFANAAINGYYVNLTSTMIRIWNAFYPAVRVANGTDTDGNPIYEWKNALIEKKDGNEYYSIKNSQNVIVHEPIEDDFVLGKTRYGVLTDVTTDFIDKVHDLASTNQTDHRMALVGFAGDSANAYDGSALYITSDNGAFEEYRYNNASVSAQYANAFRSVKNDEHFLNTMRNYKSFAQYTRQDLGMTMANKVFSAVDYTANENKDRKKIVIFITDGAPSPSDNISEITEQSVINASNANDGFSNLVSNKVANSTIYQANLLKQAGVEVYSIGIFSESIANKTAIEEFMNRVSSNNPYSESVGFMGSGGEIEDKNYCHIATTGVTLQQDLQRIFDEITGKVTASTTSLTGEAVLKDIISDDFTLPENFTANNVTVETSNYLGNGEWDTETIFVDAKIDIDPETKAINVSNFDYAENYVAEALDSTSARGKKLIVTIKGIIPKGSMATGAPVHTNAAPSGIYPSKDSSSPATVFERPTTLAVNKSYVLDFAKPITVQASDWEMKTITNMEDASSDETMDSEENAIFGTIDMKYGKVVTTEDTEGPCLTYIPQTTNWDGYDSVFVFGTAISDSEVIETNNTTNMWAKVSFIPATSVYYEDTFETNASTGIDGITYSDTVKWVVVGPDGEPETEIAEQSEPVQSTENTVYGTEGLYAGDLEYSDGSAHKATAGATAAFTFTGTGVDIYTRTTSDSGQLLVQAVSYNEDGTRKKTYTAVVDNEFISIDGGLYQIPTVTFQNMDRDTYKVTITVLSDKDENSTYYLDAIRIYNPIDETKDDVVSDAYTEAGENNALTAEVRDYIIDPENVDINKGVSGAVYIDESKDSIEFDQIATYVDKGPKNEVYLEAGQKIAFKIETPYAGKALLGMKAPAGTASKVSINNVEIEINSATDMYYEILPEEGMVVIENTGAAMISITKLRLTQVGGEAGQTLSLSATPALMAYVNKLAGVEESEDETVVNPFTDVSEDGYYYDAVLWAVENGVTSGIAPTKFGIGNACTRAEAVTFLWKAAGSPEPESTSTIFTDVSEDGYYYDAVLWAVENGITTGTGETTFSPGAVVTRGEFVTFLHRAEGKSENIIENPFTDVSEDAYYYDAVLWAVENGITDRTSSGKFNPDVKCTREQIVTFLWRVAE